MPCKGVNEGKSGSFHKEDEKFLSEKCHRARCAFIYLRFGLQNAS